MNISSNKHRKSILNFLVSMCSQIFIIALGLIIPKLIMQNYGSDTNGLVNTITQIFSYMSLLQAGIFAASVVDLYRPVSENNVDKISAIVSYSKLYYKKISLIYGFLVVLLSFCLPFVIKTEVEYFTVVILVFFEGATGVVSFYFLSSWQIILRVYGKNYIIDSLNLFQKIMTYSIKIVLVYFSANIALVQVLYFFASLVIIFIYKTYMKRNFNFINYNLKTDYKLKNRNAYVINELSSTLNNSTDLILLSIFISTSLASVYSVYNMVITYIILVISSVYNSTNYILGYTFADNLEKYKKIHNIFNSIFMSMMTILISVCLLLMPSFIKLYTSNVSDINYFNYLYPILFCSAKLISWTSNIPREALGVAGYAKKMAIASIIEALINLSVSVILVNFIGITGVLLGTLVSSPIRAIYYNYLIEKKVLHRNVRETILIYFSNFAIFGISIFIYFILPINANNYFEFILYGILLFVIYFIFVIIINAVINKDLIFAIKKLLIKKQKLK